MNPADVAAPVADISIFGMFWNAHVVVKCVMLGLLFSSVWCWAIIINKTMLFARTRKAMDQFEQMFWSGQSLEELYRRCHAARPRGMATCSWRRCASGSARSRASTSSFMGLHARHREGAGRVHRARGRAARIRPARARDRRLGRPVRRPVRHGVGHHDRVPLDRGVEEHVARRGRARHRRSACSRPRSACSPPSPP